MVRLNAAAPQPTLFPRRSLVFLFLFFVATIIRLPWFFRDEIDWDESVFILVGQALSDGHLPYVVVWDNKPPLGYLFFSAAITVFPDSLAFIRLAGAFAVSVSSFLLFLIASSIMSLLPSILSAVAFIVAVSCLIESGQAVMMEHIALMPLLAALLLIVNGSQSRSSYLFIGVFLGMATLIRLNLAYVALLVWALFPFLVGPHRGTSDRYKPYLWIGLGGALSLAFVSLPYLLTGNAGLFVKSTFIVPLAYVSNGLGYITTALAMFRGAIPKLDASILTSSQQTLQTLFWIIGFLGLLSMAFTRVSENHARVAKIIGVFAIAILISILASRHPMPHYLIQLAPIFAVALGFTIYLIRSSIVRMLAIVGSFVLIMSTVPSFSTYRSVVKNLIEGTSLYEGNLIEVATFLKRVSAPEDTIFLSSDILIYWLLKTYPVTPVAAVPANLFHEKTMLKPLYGDKMTTEIMLETVLSRLPTRIVLLKAERDKDSSPFRVAWLTRHYLENALQTRYYLENEVSGRLIFRLNQ
jgi:hypothetical protein